MKRYTIEELEEFIDRADTEEKVDIARDFIGKLTYLTDGEREMLNIRLMEALWPNDAEDPYFADMGYDRDCRDYGPSNPWDAPGMRVSDFITGVSWF